MKKHKWPINKIFNILRHKGNANQKDQDSVSLHSEWQSSREQTTNADRDVEGKETLIVSRNVS
jgi:hypothetical protein